MTKTARLAVVLWLAFPVATPLAGCGSSDDANDGSLESFAPSAPADVQAAPADAEVTASGLASKLLAAGTGTLHPASTDRVTVHYSGWTTDGRLFDSSRRRGVPSTFALDAVIRGWTEGLQLMVEGEQRRFWIPQELAYGANPAEGKPRGMLVFDVELLDILVP